jgi:hypothetical protein
VTAAAQALNAVEKAPPRTSILPDPQQLELLRSPDGTMPRLAISQVRGRGRPKGATNKRSKKVADYFVAKYGDPIDVLGQLMNTPLRQLVELLIEAEGGEEREDRLLAAVDEAVDHIKNLQSLGADAKEKREIATELAEAIDKLADAAAKISGKPGKLAMDALSLQMQATFRALEYVHGKQPISLDIAGKADVVIFAPEILKQHGIDPSELQASVAERGLEAFDPDAMRLLPAQAAEDAEFTEIDGDAPEGGAE